VGIASNFHVQNHPLIRKQDLPNLPKELQEDFDEIFLDILNEDPYDRCGFPGHILTRDPLKGWRTFDIIDEHKIAYRLVYRIIDTPSIKRVEIVSFDSHDSAYSKAEARAPRETVRKWGR